MTDSEQFRLSELYSYDIIGEAEQKDFDFLTRLAAEICGTKIALITLLTNDKQWFLSHYGFRREETAREISFCNHVINEPDKIFVVEDARKDARFSENPLVAGEMNVVFYAGVPLVNENKAALGSLCVIDDHPRKLDNEQLQTLQMLSGQVMKLLELRRKSIYLEEKNRELEKKGELLKITQSISNIGAWELDLETGQTYWSDDVYKIHEVDKAFDHNQAKGMDFYHPEDRSLISEAIKKTIETGKSFDITARLISAKNNLRWVRVAGRIRQNGQNRKKLIGSFQDITELKESEQKFRGIFNSTYSFIGFLNPQGVLLDANDTALSMAGLLREDVIGKYFWDCYWWQISEEAQENLKVNVERAKKGEEITYEVDVWIKDKKPVTILFSLRPIFDEMGEVTFIIPEGRPIQDIVDVRTRYRSVLEGTNVGTWEWNVQTGETTFNERWAEIVGYTFEELEPISIDTWENLVHPDDLKESARRLNLCFDKKAEFYELEARMKHKDGHWVWVFDRGKVFSWTYDGKPIMMYGTHQDITKRKKAEEAREELLKRFEHIGSQIPGVIYQYRLLPDGTSYLPYASSRVADIYGVTPQEAAQDATIMFEKIHSEDLERVSASIDLSARNLSQWHDIYRVNLPSGNMIWVEGSATPQKLHDGSILWHGYIKDVTERKKVEEDLKISEKAFRGNFENAGIGMALLNEDGKWLRVNKRVCDMLGYTEKELVTLTFQELTHPDDLDKDLSLLQELVAGERSHYQMEKRYIHKDGRIVHAVLAVSMVKNDHGDIIYFISQIIDITNLKIAERELSATLSQNRAILDASTQVAIISTDLNGVITEFNKGAEQMLGYKADELVGKHTPAILHLKKEIEEQEKILSEEFNSPVKGFDVFVAKAREGVPNTREWTYKRKNGSTYPVLLSVTVIKQGNKITGYLGVAADISQLKKAENEIKTILNITQDKNERLKNFAHIVTHNLRSHAAGFTGVLELLEFEDPGLYQHEYIQLLAKGTENLKETIENLTDIAKYNFTEKGDVKAVNLKKTIQRNESSLVSMSTKYQVSVYNEADEEVEVNGIPAYLDSIIMNFLTNAIKYSDPDKESYVKVRTEKRDETILLVFEDNGLGIDLQKYGDQLYGMYNTFHDHEDSRGVGLFITKNQVEALGGYIEVESEVNVGTTFTVCFPV